MKCGARTFTLISYIIYVSIAFLIDAKFAGFLPAKFRLSKKFGSVNGLATKKKIMILMSDTGGGHRASARALVDAFELLHPDAITCDIVDIWTDHSSWPYNQGISFYKWCEKYQPIWRLVWWFGKFPLTRPILEWTQELNVQRLKEGILQRNPDMLLSVHPLCQKPLLRCAAELAVGASTKLPFVTVVTDLTTAHPTWFHKDVDLCFVPSDVVKTSAERAGLQPGQIRQVSLPLRKGFWKKEIRSKTEIRRKLGLEETAPSVLLLGGGDGIGNLVGIANEIEEALGVRKGRFQMIVVCGSNNRVYQTLEQRVWDPDFNVTVLRYVANMEEYMSACDCVVTKAGPGTISEAMTRGCPTLLSCFIPGQESGNIPYVENNGFGTYCRTSKKIGQTVGAWMVDPNKLSDMSQKALRASSSSGALDIAKEISELLFNVPNHNRRNKQPTQSSENNTQKIIRPSKRKEYIARNMREYDRG